MTRILAAPAFDPGAARIGIDLPDGLTVAQMIAASLPDLAPADHTRLRATLVTEAGQRHIPPALWPHTRPRPGVRVVLRLVPGKDALRSVLTIVISVASIALGAYFGPALAATLGLPGAVGTALVGLGVTALGTLLSTALVPPVQPREERPRYQIDGWRNRFEPGGAVPSVLGEMRYAPPFAATPWTEIVGQEQYVRALFTFGDGPVRIDQIRIGDTPLSEFEDVDLQIREGHAGDSRLTLFPDQVVEERVGVDLVKPLPRDSAGNPTDSEGVETPVVRTTGEDATAARLILAFPAGLTKVDDDGDLVTKVVRLRLERRPAGTSAWETVDAERWIRGRQTEAFFRAVEIALPTRGRWDIRVTRLSTTSDATNISDRLIWAALQTIRPEYPLAPTRPLALLALRIRATYQLSGQLDNVSARVRRVAPDYDAATGDWIARPSRNPATAFRQVLQGAGTPRPLPDSALDLAALADWHDFCAARGLQYDRVLDQTGQTLREILSEIAAAGRARPVHDGLRWSVAIDRPGQPVIDHISPRNSWGFRARRSYVSPPEGFRVPFIDRTAAFARAERLVSWPDHTGDVDLTEALELPGKTDPAEIFREARRRQLEILHRPESYELYQDGPVRVATRGDIVAVSHDQLDAVMGGARVLQVIGRTVILDEEIDLPEGQTGAIRFRIAETAEDPGLSVVQRLRDVAGGVVTLAEDNPVPRPGTTVLYGLAETETRRMIVTEVETTEDGACLMRLIDEAPEIDAILDATPIPAWNGRVGTPLDLSALSPATPVLRRVRTGWAELGIIGGLEIDLAPGSGPVPTQTFLLHHRLTGAVPWTLLEIPVAEGGAALTGYGPGDTVELQVAARAATGGDSPWSGIVPIVIADDAPVAPAALPLSAIDLGALPGALRVTVAGGSDPHLRALRLYRSTDPVLDTAGDRAGPDLDLAAGQSASRTLGDATRRNLLTAPGFASATGWVPGPGWSIAGGTASHAAGSAGGLSQTVTLKDATAYRLGYRLSEVGGGSVTPQLQGAATSAGVPRSSDGLSRERLVSATGQTALAFEAENAFTGQLDDVLLYEESTACLAQGTHYVWVQPVGEDGRTGPISGPVAVTIT
ncbi:TipJ family phage tail tip protein [Palleronia caenipelagi]|uniref:Phage tail protein n=1 Tax=Palleronia caenipelagi TaxID=2489174 RepID=A0A547PW41_9RHOB|nr:phage tail protein [Palleronia caenipelagi]TRD18353.1 phage tail protein [Palleronia caenipelagi]